MRASNAFLAISLAALSWAMLCVAAAFAAPAEDASCQGREMLAKHQYSQAVAVFDKVISAEPENAAAYFNRGLAHAKLRQDYMAIDDLSRSISYDSTRASVYTLRALEYYRVGRDQLAVEDCNTANKLDPNFAIAYYLRGFLNTYHSLNSKNVEATSASASYSLSAGANDVLRAMWLDPMPICLFVGVTVSVAAAIVLLWLRVLLGPFAELLHMHEISKGVKMRPLSTLFHVAEGDRDWKAMVRWWEVRRFSYNFCVGLAGLVSLAMILAVQKVSGLTLLSAVFGVLCYGVAANLCYSFGWTGELTARRMWGYKAQYFGPVAFSLGMIFSIGLTLVPGTISVCYPGFAQWLVG